MSQKTTKTYLIPGATITQNMAVLNPQANKKTSSYQQMLDRQVAQLMAADSRIAR
ncbi:MAG: hypothetical protein KA314_04790 [Chloroflexi bacterium]|nr:hypothetical protein [Chloroflexota bacterium]